MLWFKVFHVLFVMAWMAALFYLPRILVHYVEGLAAGEDIRRLTTMAHKLNRFGAIMGVLAMAFGSVLWLYYGIAGTWLVAKLGLVGLLIAYQVQTWRYIQLMHAGEPIRTSLFFRLYNESALLVVIPILILVIVKPF